MLVHRWPSSRLIHNSPLVVPKYSPTGSRASAVMALRFAALLGTLFPDPPPLVRRPIQPVDAAVILLIQPVRVARAEPHAMGVVNGDIGGVEARDHFHPFYDRRKAPAALHRFMHPAARHGEIKMIGIARVNDERMLFRSA